MAIGAAGVTLESVVVVLGPPEHAAHQAAGFFLVARDHSQPAAIIARSLSAVVCAAAAAALHAKGAAAHAPRPTFAADRSRQHPPSALGARAAPPPTRNAPHFFKIFATCGFS